MLVSLCEVETNHHPVEELETMLKRLNSRLNDLNKQTPIISTKSMSKAEKAIKSGRYKYEVDKVAAKESTVNTND